jgi:hypothetical protein
MVSPRGMKIYTVLDARPSASGRYLLQTLLLAHSWAAQSGAPPLHVIVIGTAPRPVQRRLRDLGIELTSSPPHPLDALSRTTNKLVALREDADGPVLLVDNDVVFLDALATFHGRGVSASVASRARITAAQWSHVRKTTGLRPLANGSISLREELKARKQERDPEPDRGLYLNTGVVWIEQPADFGSIWSTSIAAVARAFEDHPLSSPWVRGWGSDQAGFATAVAEQGDFSLLSPSYNHRPVCFRLGLRERPKILHLQKLGADGAVPFSKLLAAWWDRRVIKPIMREGQDGPSWRPIAERDRLLDEAVSLRNHVLTLGKEARLDELLPLAVSRS